MRWLLHLLLVALYGAAAVAAALLLPARHPDLAPDDAAALAAAAFAGVAALHFAIAQMLLNRRLAARLATLDAASAGLREDMTAARAELSNLGGLLRDGALGQTSAEVVSEMRVLRSLLTQLNAKRGNRGANATGTARNDLLVDATRPLPIVLPKTLSDSAVLDIVAQALRENRVDVYLQPVVSLPQRQVRSYEAFRGCATATAR